MSKTDSSRARWIGIFVLILIVSLAEPSALILDYQNNRYLRQYVTDNLGMIVAASIGLLVVASVSAYVLLATSEVSRPKGFFARNDYPFRLKILAHGFRS
jgi:hypothetical protein